MSKDGKNFVKDALNTKITPDSATLATLLATSIAASAGLTAMSEKSDSDVAQGKIDGLKSVELAAKEENAPKTLAAIEQEKIAATSRIIKDRTAEGWALGGTIVAATAGLGAAAQIGRNKKKPGAENETDQNTSKTRG